VVHELEPKLITTILVCFW